MGKTIVFLARHCCMRVVKEAIPLIRNGYKIHLITEQIAQFTDCFHSISVYWNLDQLYNAIKLFNFADIFHVHNEPSFYVTAVKEIFPRKPVVLDVHDTMLLRRTDDECRQNKEYFKIHVDERNNIQLADGLVYVCEPMKKEIEETYKPHCPSVVLPSYVPKQFYRIDFDRWLGGIVYEGRIDMDGELTPKWDFFSYSNYINCAKKFAELGIDFHIYTPRKNEKVREVYVQYCILNEPLAFDKLIRCIGRHDWGLVGNLGNHLEWKYALPNKLFEYLAGCVPVVCLNAEESGKFITEHDIGIIVSSVEELAEKWSLHREKRINLIKKRNDFVMENHINAMEGLYSSLS